MIPTIQMIKAAQEMPESWVTGAVLRISAALRREQQRVMENAIKRGVGREKAISEEKLDTFQGLIIRFSENEKSIFNSLFEPEAIKPLPAVIHRYWEDDREEENVRINVYGWGVGSLPHTVVSDVGPYRGYTHIYDMDQSALNNLRPEQHQFHVMCPYFTYYPDQNYEGRDEEIIGTKLDVIASTEISQIHIDDIS